jgi:5-methylcytosine-specific restriction endonuclease McrA
MRVCSIEGCERVHHANGFCNSHQQRGYRDRKEYTNARNANNRKAWISEQGGKCAECGEDDYALLEVDHIDASTKLFNIGTGWSCYKSTRMQVELAKCQVLCRSCHKHKTTMHNESPGNRNTGLARGPRQIGENNGNAKLTDAQVIEIIALWKTGDYFLRQIAAMFNVSISTIHLIVQGKSWKNLKENT